MSFRSRAFLLLVLLASAAMAFGEPAFSREEPHNLILIVPEALPAIGVDQTNAPTLARLRHEGTSFINSHSGFPRLTAGDPFNPQSNLKLELLAGAAAQQYATAFVNDTRHSSREPSDALRKLVTVTLPQFKQSQRPFFLIYRLAEPQYAPPPGNEARPAYEPAPRATNMAVETFEAALKTLDLYESTNIIVAAEHAYSRILKVSHTSRARVLLPREDTLGTLPPGFLAIDIAAALQTDDSVINLFDPDNGNAFVDWTSGGHPKRGNAIIAAGYDPAHPYVTVEAHGAYGSIYLADSLSKSQRRWVAHTIMEAVLEQDYLGGVFVDERRVGQLPGALSLNHITSATTAERQPDMVIAFASVTAGCAQAVTCTSVIADSPLPEGEGVPNAFNRAGTWTFMAARGPDFQSGLIDRAPASNADIARTVVELLDLDIERKDSPNARVLTESLAGARGRNVPQAMKVVHSSVPSIEGLTTEARLQTLGAAKYFDTAIQAHVERVAEAYAPRPKWRWPRLKQLTIEISDEDDF